jgi:hypothetical protein
MHGVKKWHWNEFNFEYLGVNPLIIPAVLHVLSLNFHEYFTAIILLIDSVVK